jgi:LPXTG-site transpeptidase (sortase) family protein
MHRWRHIRFILVGLASLVLVVLAVFLLLYSNTGVKQTSQLPGGSVTSPTTQATGTRTVAPTRTGTPQAKVSPTAIIHPTNGSLSIPSVGINAPIENVGLASDGTLDVPAQQPWTDVGWYQYGPYPGTRGSSVIDGHLDRPGGSPAVFWNLKNVHVGDIVTVTNSKGKVWHFRVTAMKYYTPDAAPVSSIFNNTSGTYLNLITCAGTWVPAIHQTTLRLVIYTVLV